MTAVMTSSELERKGRAQRPEQGWSIPESCDCLWMLAHASGTNLTYSIGQSPLNRCCPGGFGDPPRETVANLARVISLFYTGETEAWIRMG